jgi:hypothetical protein
MIRTLTRTAGAVVAFLAAFLIVKAIKVAFKLYVLTLFV